MGGPALATDGVIEINQAKVMALGGFPFTITQSASYRLTSNLYTPDANTTAIKVNVDGVTIDLNGFSIIGPGTAGSGIGIDASSQYLITIYNGEVAGMGGDGITAGNSSRIEGVRLLNNGGDGILCYVACAISHNIANNNRSIGIATDGPGRISSNVTQFNGLYGILVAPNSVVVDNTADHNGSDGIEVEGSGTGAIGTVFVRGNTASANGGDGLFCGSITGYTGNVFSGNHFGSVDGEKPCVNLGHNLCDGAICP